MKEYLIITTDRWTFYEIHTYKKGEIYIELTNSCKYGNIRLKIYEDEFDPVSEEYWDRQDYIENPTIEEIIE